MVGMQRPVDRLHQARPEEFGGQGESPCLVGLENCENVNVTLSDFCAKECHIIESLKKEWCLRKLREASSLNVKSSENPWFYFSRCLRGDCIYSDEKFSNGWSKRNQQEN
jgi:hypothetical protein